MHKGVQDVSAEGRSIHVLVLAPHFSIRLIHILFSEWSRTEKEREREAEDRKETED